MSGNLARPELFSFLHPGICRMAGSFFFFTSAKVDGDGDGDGWTWFDLVGDGCSLVFRSLQLVIIRVLV